MKKIYLLFFLSIITSLSIAQITITNANNGFVDGDSFLSGYMDTTGVKEGAAGSNVVWNFSSLTPNTYYFGDNFINPTGTTWENDFTGSNLGYISSGAADSTFGYYKTSSTKFEYMGNKNPTGSLIFSNYKTLMTFPFTYNSTFTDTYGGSSTNGSIPSNYSGTISAIGDAYGTLNLFNKSFNDAVRVKTTDIYSNNLGFIIFNYTVTTYYWYVTGYKNPIMYLQYYHSDAGGNFPYDTKSVAVDMSLFTGINNIQTVSNLNVYPNPTNKNTGLNIIYTLTSTEDVSISVINNLGQKIAEKTEGNQSAGNYTSQMDISNISAGIYFVQIKTTKGIKTEKLIIE